MFKKEYLLAKLYVHHCHHKTSSMLKCSNQICTNGYQHFNPLELECQSVICTMVHRLTMHEMCELCYRFHKTNLSSLACWPDTKPGGTECDSIWVGNNWERWYYKSHWYCIYKVTSLKQCIIVYLLQMWDRRDMHEMFCLENLEGSRYLECKVLAGIIVLKWILTLIPLTWRIWWAPNNASRWQTGFNSALKG